MNIINRRFTLLIAAAAALLSIPLVAMQFTSEVNWSASDFLVGGILLFGTAIFIELTLRFAKGRLSRMLLCALILLIAFLLWAELAVGIFGTPWAGS